MFLKKGVNMIKVEGYKCEYCNKLHESEVCAMTCEQTHIKVVSVKGIYNENDSFPKEVIVTFEDGKRAYYDYSVHVG
jgi:Fe-S-cluster-containing hydrogenase component 2